VLATVFGTLQDHRGHSGNALIGENAKRWFTGLPKKATTGIEPVYTALQAAA
jgi:hypothetical protein